MNSAALRRQIEFTLEKRISGALNFRPVTDPETIPTGIPSLDQRIQGIPKGALSEVCGPASSGRTTLLHALLRQVTESDQCCALIDTSNAFDPISAAANRIDFSKLLWVKCAGPHPKLTPLDKALRSTEEIIHKGGFALIALDLADVEPRLVQKIPLSYWYKFRRAAEANSASFLVIEKEPFARSCASLVITLTTSDSEWVPTRNKSHNPKLFTGANFAADVTRSRFVTFQRKPQGSASLYRAATSWAG